MENNLNLINSFLEILTIENGLAKNTILSYQNDLKLFLIFLKEKNYHFLNSKEKTIEDYLQKLYQDGLSPTSTSRKISTIKHFFKFLETDGYRSDNPTINIASPKKNNKLPKVLSEKQIFTLLETINKDNSEFGIRLSCMLEILYASGLRVSELVSLPICVIQKTINKNDISFKNYLIIEGKGRKERIAPLNNSALKALKAYLGLRENIGHQNSKWLFCGHSRSSKKERNIGHIQDKQPITIKKVDKHITRQRFHQMLKELALKAGIDPKKVSPHIIRHSFASHLLNNGIDLRVLQELLGHSDISTTQIYTHILDSKLRELVYKHHPLANNNL